jgi:alkylation response protein AidB-like acyl-CoA dehydrogenase
MFDLTPTAEQQRVLEALNGLVEEVRDIARAANTSREHNEELLRRIESAAGVGPDAIATGNTVLTDPVGFVLVGEALGYADAGTAFDVLGRAQAQLLAHALGADAFADRIADVRTTRQAALALHEGYGRSPSQHRSQVRRSGDEWLITGRKDPVVAGGRADALLVLGHADSASAIALLTGATHRTMVERDDAREGTVALGLARTCTIELDTVVAEDDVSVDIEPNCYARAVAAQRLLIPAIAIGVAQAAVDSTAEWVNTRSVRGSALANNQGVSFPLVDGEIFTSRARLMLWDFASSLKFLEDVAEIERRTARVIANCCAAGTKAARIACNVMGWRGLSHQYLAEMRYRDAAALSAIDFDVLQNPVPAVEAA